MADFNGTDGDDSWTVTDPDTFSLDGLGGIDTLDLGTSLRSSYRVTQDSDGVVHVDSISSASGALHATLLNMERLVFNSGRDVIDLTTHFGDHTPPTVSISDDSPGTARGNVTYSLAFSENISGLAADDFTVGNGTVISVAGSASRYSVVVAPAPGIEATMALTLKAGAVTDGGGNPNAQASAAAQAIDTKAPVVGSFSPADKANAVAVGSDIVLTFSENIQRGSGTITLKDGGGNVVAAFDAASSANISIAGGRLTLNPSADLPHGMPITVVLSAGSFKDLAGNPFAGAAGYGFTTAVDPLDPKLTGTLADDTFAAITGRVAIDGLAGIDTVVLSRQRSAYSVADGASTATVAAKDGTTTLALNHIERLQFTDAKLALDIGGHAGQVAEILGAVFGAGSVANAAYVGIGLQFADGGMTFEALVQLALNARLGAGASNGAVVDLLYTNVVGGAPAAADRAFYVALLDNHTFTPATLGVLAAQTDLNQAHIDLVGLAQTGIVFS